jgi:phosphate transport system substrate-binding protein
MFKRIISIAASAAVVAGVLIAAPAQAAGTPINGAGSSFANNAMQACLAAYQTNTTTYLSTGSGTGKSFFKGTITAANIATYGAANVKSSYDFAATDSFFSSSDKPAFDFVTVPLLGGPVAFAYTAAGLSDGLNLTPQNLSDIFTGRVTKWNDASIKANNSKLKLPNKTIKVNYRSGSSGTNENISNYLAQNLPGSGWVKNSTWETAISSARPFTKDADGNYTTTRAAVVGTGHLTSSALAGVLEDSSNGFGYFDLSDAITADVAIAKLQNKAGAFIAPTASAAAKFLNAQSIVSSVNDWDNGTVAIDFTKNVSGAYQLSILTYGLAPRFTATATVKVSTSASKLAVGDFFKYVVTSCIPQKAATLGYVALGGALKTSALNQIKKIG